MIDVNKINVLLEAITIQKLEKIIIKKHKNEKLTEYEKKIYKHIIKKLPDKLIELGDKK